MKNRIPRKLKKKLKKQRRNFVINNLTKEVREIAKYILQRYSKTFEKLAESEREDLRK